MADFRNYGIEPEKGRKYENIIYVMALIYDMYMSEISHYLAQYDLSPAKFNLLMVVAYQGGAKGITQVAIGEKLIVSPGNITGLVEKLVKDGFITRTQNPQSRRENIIKITAKGQKLIDKVWPGYDALAKKMTDILPGADQANLTKILEKWFGAMKDVKN
ncbi:DNA-binding MarR family transcriptional regulator [Elusimicrobium posterum]|uniref:MarR family winged helix-turn-helix transcriptional regulator n=1 Tax=Elusimicrobium posterum TaxID=3116653 RepID=UPI003C75B621